jgi:hypothetical protein
MAGMNSFVGSLATFPVIYSTMGAIAGITHRVGQLLQALEELEVGYPTRAHSCFVISLRRALLGC